MEHERVSFRDPQGQLIQTPQNIFRAVRPELALHVESILRSKTVTEWTQEGKFIATRPLPSHPTLSQEIENSLWFEHPRILFPSFAYEWCPEMLAEAAHLTLDLQEGLLNEGLGLKDATPDNILFEGTRPIFIDLLSVEKRSRYDACWLPFAQFLRTFITPLLANQKLNLALNMVFLTHRDGLPPDEVYRMCGPWRRYSPSFFTIVTVPTWLGDRRSAATKTETKKAVDYHVSDPEKAKFILSSLTRHLRTTLKKVSPNRDRVSRWSLYLKNPIEYTPDAFSKKEKFVTDFVDRYKPSTVLDVGCNTGHFSLLAARCGASIVAIDGDETAVGHVFRLAQEKKVNILPLVVNLARPSPATGWRNGEFPSFLERAESHFDAVLMLAVIHHLLWTERIPLEEVVKLAARITRRFLVIEYVDPTDPSFIRMMKGREGSLPPLRPELFERSFQSSFKTIETIALTTSRMLYLFEKLPHG